MIKAILFDFDDTLCLTEEASFNLENDILKFMKRLLMTRDIHKSTWGMPIQEAISKRSIGIDVTLFMKLHKRFMSEYVLLKKIDTISDENIALLHALKSNGKRLAIVTSRSFHEVKHLLEKMHPLNNLVEILYHKDNSEYLKPDPRVFDKALSYFNVKPSECLYVGDSLTDAIASNAAHIPFIAILENNIKTKEDFDNMQVVYFAKKFSDISFYIN